jgi:shikimate dehydrogenase
MSSSPPGTIRLGLVGEGILASRTPAMHVAEARAQGIECTYDIIDLDSFADRAQALPRILDDCERRGFRGLNVTHPCKRSVLGLLDELSAEARALGAVNTVLFEGGRRIGHNTDWSGFAESVRRGLPRARLRNIVQLGAGGAGAAVAYAALSLGTNRIEIFDAEPSRAQDLASRLCRVFAPERIAAVRDLTRAMAAADGLIHATPTGMDKYPGLPLPSDLLRAELWVAEIVYLPLETELLRVARALGCRVISGRWMAVFQAAQAFELFTGIAPDTDRMAHSFDSAVSDPRYA